MKTTEAIVGLVSWHRITEDVWCSDDGQAFTAIEKDGKWYVWLDDAYTSKRGPFETANQAMAYAS